MNAKIIITRYGADSCHLEVIDPLNHLPDLAAVRPLLIQSLLAIEGEVGEKINVEVPVMRLSMLRNFLDTLGAADKLTARRLLLMALLQLEDEDEALRRQKPSALLPILAVIR